MHESDLIVIGGGIVGLATAYRFLERYPGKRVVVLEKEAAIARHQTGHNSGVLHTGIYYKPGSLKAVNCRAGKAAMQEFCRRENIPFELCGKVIVATDTAELPRMELLLERGAANGVACRRIGPAEIREIEPHAAGIGGIHVPEAGIVDFNLVAARLAEIIIERGGRVVTSARVTGIRQDTSAGTAGGRAVVVTTADEFAASQIINCAGLHCDRVARLSGVVPSARIIPFRGEYYALKPEAHHLVKSLIYPVPDPKFPFLGVHFTRRIGGLIDCGPNAVLALAREGYRHTNINFRDLAETLTYVGFWKLAARYWKIGTGEMVRSFSKAAFVRALQRLVPAIESQHLEWAPAGVRAQAVSPDGAMVDDFLIEETAQVINVQNAPSPAATASLNIGNLIIDRLASRLPNT
ncbi:MAG: L-2-hydroxyglutarate oxidase [Pirellulales bacterium]|nr:L-2-hydroxyglutarate oxidase [Pirellulales bacterium]